MIDSHNHIDAKAYKTEPLSVKKVLSDARAAGVRRIVAPALHLQSYSELREIAAKHPEVYPAVGVHPHEASEEFNHELSKNLQEALRDAPHPIVGETGLEGHYDFTPMEVQMRSLQSHLEVAQTHGLPIILHCRETEEILFNELKRWKLPVGGVVHCFTGSWEWAQRFLDLGFHIGITGIVTFKKSTQVQEVATRLPQDRLLVETDGPYLAPVPYRGKINKPEYIPHIVRKIAELRGVSEEQIARLTVSNTEKLFGLPKL